MPSSIRSGSIVLAHPDAIRRRRPGVAVDRIVVHVMEGTLPGTMAWFSSPRSLARQVATAAHYLVSRAGDVVQMVPDDRKCYHAGSRTEPGWNDRSIGIEHEGWTDGIWRQGPQPWMLAEPRWPAAMLDASAVVVRIVARKYDIPLDRIHVLGHAEVPGVAHTDPGASWPWSEYMARLGTGIVVNP